MEIKGFIVSCVDPSDKRQRIVSATKTAKDLAENIEIHRVDLETRMSEGMTTQELVELKLLLYKIYLNISHK